MAEGEKRKSHIFRSGDETTGGSVDKETFAAFKESVLSMKSERVSQEAQYLINNLTGLKTVQERILKDIYEQVDKYGELKGEINKDFDVPQDVVKIVGSRISTAVQESVLKKTKDYRQEQGLDKATDFSKESKIMSVRVVEIDDAVLDTLKLKKEGGNDLTNLNDTGVKREGGFWESVKRSIGPLILLGGGLVASLNKMMTMGNPIQGVFTILSKGIATIMDGLSLSKINPNIVIDFFIDPKTGVVPKTLRFLFGSGSSFAKTISTSGSAGKALAKFGGKTFLKRIPIIGSLISIGSAINRFRSGNIIQGLIDIGAAVATMFPFAGTAIAVGLDLLNATIDVYKLPSGKAMINKALSNMANFFITNGKKLPIIGSLIHVGEAIGSLAKGDIGAFIDSMVASGNMIPGVAALQGLFNWSYNAGQAAVPVAIDMAKAVGNFTKFITNKISSFVKGGLDSLSNLLPSGILNRALDFLGLSQFKREDNLGENNWINREAGTINISKTKDGEKRDVNDVIRVLRDADKSDEEIFEVLKRNKENIDLASFNAEGGIIQKRARSQQAVENNERIRFEREMLELQRELLNESKRGREESLKTMQSINSSSNSVSNYNLYGQQPLHTPFREQYAYGH